MKLDPNNTWRLVEQRLAAESDPVLRRNLELVLAHMKAEARADIEGVVETLVEKPRYVMHDDPENPLMNPDGSKDAVRKFYDLTIVQTGAHRLELACDRVIVDRDSVFTEGVMRMAYPGATLRAMGIDVDDPESYYLYETRMGIVWPVDPAEGKLIGEESYTGRDGFEGIEKRKISLADIAPLVSGG
jgi:hypothetical protein